MKSKTSCFNKTIFKKNITRFWAIWLIFLLWNLFILPFNIFIASLHWGNEIGITQAQIASDKVVEIAQCVGIYMNPILLFIFSVAVATAIFSYLYTFRAANMIHALPVTRKELFVTNYISGLVFLFVPLLVGFLTGTLVGAACGYTALDYIFKGMLYAMGLSFFFYNFAVFVAMVVGTTAAVPVFAIILNYLYVGCKLLVKLLMSCVSYGVQIELSQGKADILSPLYYIGNKVMIEYDYSGQYAVCKGLQGGNVVIGYAIAAIPFLIGAYLLYKKRDIETAGSLITVTWIAPIFRWGTAFCGGTLLSVFICQLVSSHSARVQFWVTLISALIFGTAIFFCAQMSLEKGFRVFKKKRFVELGGFLVVMFVALFALENDWFGIEKKIPEMAEIERAYLYHSYPVGGEDRESIEVVRNIHQQCIENKREFEDYVAATKSYEKMTGVSVKYFLKDGSVMERHYTMPMEEDNAVYKELYDYAYSTKAYTESMFGRNYENFTMKSGMFDYFDGEGYPTYEFDKEDAEKIYQAFLADLEAGNLQTVIRYQSGNNTYADDGDDAYDKEIYYNSISLEYSSPEVIQNIQDEYYKNESNMYYVDEKRGEEGSVSITFSVDCENIIQTLKEIGAIESEENLITVQEVEESDKW